MTPIVCLNCTSLSWAKGAKKRCLCHGCNLDLGCGPHKQKGFIGVDRREVDGVDLIFDLEKFPWGAFDSISGKAIPDNCVDKLLCSHLFEHIKPWLTIDFMDEMWRVMKFDSQALIVVPYAGSFGFWQDPTHTKGFNEATWAYFDPSHPSRLYSIYQPKPWHITRCHWNPLYNMEVILEPMKTPDGDPTLLLPKQIQNEIQKKEKNEKK